MGKVSESSDWIDKVHPSVINPYNEIRNTIILMSETLEKYQNITLIELEGEFLQNIMLRIITITRWGYVAVFSIIEYTIKEIIAYNKNENFRDFIISWESGDFISFNNIIKRLKEMGIINDFELRNWDAHREIRNCIVHNNSIPNINVKYDLDGFILNGVKDVHFSGPLDGFLILIEKICKLYFSTLNHLNLNTNS